MAAWLAIAVAAIMQSPGFKHTSTEFIFYLFAELQSGAKI
jgi:hypothetical protein